MESSYSEQEWYLHPTLQHAALISYIQFVSPQIRRRHCRRLLSSTDRQAPALRCCLLHQDARCVADVTNSEPSFTVLESRRRLRVIFLFFLTHQVSQSDA